MLTKAFIPYKGYYSSPFARWQGSMANDNAISLAGDTSQKWMKTKGWDPEKFEYVILGVTVGQPYLFFSGPWVAALCGAVNSPGLLLSQACSTSTTGIFQAATGVETGMYEMAYTVFTDRCSNGPHTVWPDPLGPGGKLYSEDWVMDHFGHDPWAGQSMAQTGENVAKENGITREECDALALRRYQQYTDALADDRAFQKRYMFPVEVSLNKKKKITIEADEGITECTAEGLARLRPTMPGGVLTFGAQTHPADGHCGVAVMTKEKADEYSADTSVTIQILSYGYTRVKKAYMPMAPYPAAKMALDKAGLGINDVAAIKTHNPFAVNDIYMAKQFNIDVNGFNNYGSSLIFGHPQAPTAGRLIIEGIEELAMKGGGYLLYTGCAAGDTAGAMVLKISC